MEDQRKKIIVKEIEHWRKNHLLPEHYCIFLLNLYTEGERAAQADSQVAAGQAVGGRSKNTSGYQQGVGWNNTVSWKMILFWLVGAAVIAGFILLAFHFNDFSFLMQITISSCITLFFYILAHVCRRFSPVFTHVSLLLSFLLLIFGGVYFLKQIDAATDMLTMFLLAICLLFCLNGLIFRFLYLVYCGFIGLGLLYGYVTLDRVSALYSWWLAELYWVPFALFMIGVGFLLNQRNPRIAGALCICGILFFFGAEVQSLYISQAKQDTIQLLLFIKIFISSLFFFFTRQQWFTWLRL
ncbi:UNVERIFIED_CONTAM: hypothetical protein ABID98_002660 [Brevibacillus sp. OAP136]